MDTLSTFSDCFCLSSDERYTSIITYIHISLLVTARKQLKQKEKQFEPGWLSILQQQGTVRSRISLTSLQFDFIDY